MAHEIEGNKMFSVRLEPWHKLGVVLQNPPTSAEAIKAAGMAWQVERRELWWAKTNNDLQKVPNRVALVRDEDEKLLSVVSEDYEPLQNLQAFEFFDPLVQAGDATYETAGVLCGGKKVWIQAKLSLDRQIAGDQHKPYVLLTNGHDGQTALMVMPSFQRVVCNNTLRMALAEGGIVYYKHTKGVTDKLEGAKQLLNLIQQKMDELDAALIALNAKPIDPAEMDAYLNGVLAINEEPLAEDEVTDEDGEKKTDYALKHKLCAKARIFEIHEGGRGFTPNTGTYLGAYNSVVAFVDHFAGNRAKDRGNWLLFGDGGKMKDRALELAMSN